MSTRIVLSIICGLGVVTLPGFAQANSEADSLIQAGASQTNTNREDGLAASSGSPVQISWDVTLASKYLFLGVDLSDENAVLQPEAILGIKNFSFTFWVNHDLDRQKPNELDFVLQYAWELGRFALSPGYAYYSYPHRTGWDPSQEVLLDVSCSAPLSPSLSVNYDFDSGEGTYFTLGISQGLESLALPLSLGANLFYQEGYYEQTGFPAAELNVSVGHGIGPIEITPSVSYFATWGNGDFQGASQVPSTWLFAINVAQAF